MIESYNKFLVVGAWNLDGDIHSEECSFKESTLVCYNQSPNWTMAFTLLTEIQFHFGDLANSN